MYEKMQVKIYSLPYGVISIWQNQASTTYLIIDEPYVKYSLIQLKQETPWRKRQRTAAKPYLFPQ